MAQQRLQKIIARAGLASRRGAEELIVAGRVRVNGRVVRELGSSADDRRDRIEVDGQRLMAEPQTYVLLHKPRCVVATLNNPEGRPTVAELVADAPVRLFSVGRLDFATSGVLLMTNDGDFSDALLRPRTGVPKTYVAKLADRPPDDVLEAWQKGIALEEGRTRPAEVRRLGDGERDRSWVEITLREGKNRQIHRMAEATGMRIMRLARISFAGITCDGLRPGRWRPLSADELRQLQKSYGVPKRIRTAPQQSGRGRSRAGRTDRSGRKPRAAGRPGAPGRGRGRR